MTKDSMVEQPPQTQAVAEGQPRAARRPRKLAKLDALIAVEENIRDEIRQGPPAPDKPRALRSLDKKITALKRRRRNVAGGLGRARARAHENYARDQKIAAEYNAPGSHSGRSATIAKRENLSRKRVVEIARTFKPSAKGERAVRAEKEAERLVERKPGDEVRGRELAGAIPYIERMLGSPPKPGLIDEVRHWPHWKLQWVEPYLGAALHEIYSIQIN